MKFNVPGLTLSGGLQGVYIVKHELTGSVVFRTRKLSMNEGSAFCKAAASEFTGAEVWRTCRTEKAIKRWFHERPETFWRMWDALVGYR